MGDHISCQRFLLFFSMTFPNCARISQSTQVGTHNFPEFMLCPIMVLRFMFQSHLAAQTPRHPLIRDEPLCVAHIFITAQQNSAMTRPLPHRALLWTTMLDALLCSVQVDINPAGRYSAGPE